ncbi:kinase-like domain-containing protein [Rhizophagus diaphanus]|nr:kinase-like domain-containing protein [Rhizophagus diaphanus] [Rhizophagus sp. MUCL 43196]
MSHSNHILIHQNIVKLTDFGLSQRIEEVTKSHSELFVVIPYVDPEIIKNQEYKLNEMSDVYSVGVLLWEISSGRLPFEEDGDLIEKTLQGFREVPIPDTPTDYVSLYKECWNGEPDKRSTMSEVVNRLRNISYAINNTGIVRIVTKNLSNTLIKFSTDVINNFITNEVNLAIDEIKRISNHFGNFVSDSLVLEGRRNSEACNKWIEEAINNGYLKHYHYTRFYSLAQICCEGFGNIYSARYFDKYLLALKSFRNSEKKSTEEIVREFYGISIGNSGGKMEEYLIVMEHANACAVSCLHHKGFIHHDLITSGQPPFNGKGSYFLVVKIPEGLRETSIPDTPTGYVDLYTSRYEFQLLRH